MLTPIIMKLIPTCELCNNPTGVAHHHVHKSKSLALRYYIPNLIGLCGGCHFKLHQNESYWASVIVKKRGMEWFDDLEAIKNTIVKADRFWYEARIQELEVLLCG